MFTGCPYCKANSFEIEAVPANNEAIDASEKYGDWFNQCTQCRKWSRYIDDTGEQKAIERPDEAPKKVGIG